LGDKQRDVSALSGNQSSHENIEGKEQSTAIISLTEENERIKTPDTDERGKRDGELVSGPGVTANTKMDVESPAFWAPFVHYGI
jgi:hypothetical protein